MRLLVALCVIAFPLAAAAEAEADGVATVSTLYHDYAWEAVIDEPMNVRVGVMQESRAVLDAYFDPTLAKLIRDDVECGERSGEVCRLDFSPVWAGQDPGADELAITATDDPTRVLVKFRYPGNGETVTLNYTLVQGKSGWRIANIATAEWDLLQILSATD